MRGLRYFMPDVFRVLRIRQFIGGVEISDLAVRFASFDGKTWRLASVRIEPDVLEAGKIKDRAKFVAALKELKGKAYAGKTSKKMPVVVSLSSIGIYSQVFSLPIMKGQNLDRAIQLNVQMVSPVDSAQAYSGWQVVGEDQKSLRLEILSAFIDRPIVEELVRALREAGFLAVVLESRSLALTRLLREEGVGIDNEKSYILVSVDSSGADFLVIRRGQLYFEYFNPWRDIADEKGQVSTQTFESAMTRSLHQVLNFYGQHWPEPVFEVVISATALREETQNIIKINFSLAIREFTLKGEQADSEWFVAVGCGLRGMKRRSRDIEMSLLGIGAQEEFRQEQLMAFGDFWRLLVPSVFGLFLLFLGLTQMFLHQTSVQLESQIVFSSRIDSPENKALRAHAEEFNKTVAFIKSVRTPEASTRGVVEKIRDIASPHGIVIRRISFENFETPVAFVGEAVSEEKLSSFKKALEGDARIKDVSLFLSDIHPGLNGVAFSLTFGLQ